MKPLSGIFSVVAVGLLSQAAWSAESLAQKVEACAQHKDDASRLQCFDGVVSALRAERVTKDTAADHHAAEASRPSRTDSPREKPTAVQPTLVQPVTARVVAISKTAGRARRIELDNGQVWQENEYDASLMLSPGDSVQIRPGALKSSLLRAPSGANTKVHRVR